MSPRQAILRFCVALLVIGRLFGSGQKPVHSEPDLVIEVNSFEDLPDNIDNDVCSAGDPTEGPCTLRAAISWANWRINTRNIIIKLPAGVYTLTIPPNYGTSNDNLTGDLNINSPGVAITNTVKIEPLSGGSVVIRSLIDDRILSLNQHARVTINNITLREGHAVLDTNNPNGGGAILNRGFLTLNGVSLLSNTVTCAVEGPCASAGGAIENWGTLTIQDSTLDGNTALQGGAILNGSSPSADLTIQYSTLSNNQDQIYGTIGNFSKLSILNSTFSGNRSAENAYSSGIYNSGTLKMRSSTMANFGNYSAIFNANGSAVQELEDNIFRAEPGYENCAVIFGSSWTTGGYNIANDNSCNLSAEGDLSNTDPMLGSLDYWGGPTKTIMLIPGSPAIDHRQTNCMFTSNFLDKDQRHWERDDVKCDTGAFEYHDIIDVGATKVWMPSGLSESLKIGVSFQLYRETSSSRTPEKVGDPVAVTSSSGWKAIWPQMPIKSILLDKPYTYFVREVSTPKNFTADDVDDLTVTNTSYSFLYLPLISK